MAELGIGVRVRVGWTPSERLLGPGKIDGRLRTGTISDGLFPPGYYVGETTGQRYRLDVTCWNVALDGGGEIFATENMLFPLDDDNDQITRHERELVEERV